MQNILMGNPLRLRAFAFFFCAPPCPCKRNAKARRRKGFLLGSFPPAQSVPSVGRLLCFLVCSVGCALHGTYGTDATHGTNRPRPPIRPMRPITAHPAFHRPLSADGKLLASPHLCVSFSARRPARVKETQRRGDAKGFFWAGSHPRNPCHPWAVFGLRWRRAPVTLLRFVDPGASRFRVLLFSHSAGPVRAGFRAVCAHLRKAPL